jgi:hypothetical protein
MDINGTIKDFLFRNGWQSEPINGKQEIDLRMAFQNANSRILVDHRFKRKEFWIWLVSENAKNCLAFGDGENVVEMIQAVNSMKNSLNAGDYFGLYIDLQKTGEVSVLCWEQFQETDTSRPVYDIEEEFALSLSANHKLGMDNELNGTFH